MYSSHRPIDSGLTRFGSAPSSLLKSLVDSVVAEEDFSAVGSDYMMGRFFSCPSSCLTAESSCKATDGQDLHEGHKNEGVKTGLLRSYGLNETNGRDFGMVSSLKDGPSLTRHSSPPPRLLSNLQVDNDFLGTRGIGFSPEAGNEGGSHGVARVRVKSQLNFSRWDSLSQLSEISIPEIGESLSVGGRSAPDDTAANAGESYRSGNFRLRSWDETKSIVFSPPSKRARDNNGDIIFSNIESQFSLPTTSLEMATVENLFQMQHDSVPCKIRARRGCATHPRSIAERDRRTRISDKLRKLEELVPNTDKQTNTAEMLDLAVQHIKTLQSQVQRLKQDLVNCTCVSKEGM